MKKNIALFAISTTLLFSSCDKDNKTLYEKEITGVNLTNEMAVPMGSIGSPDVKSSTDGINMSIYPTPCSSLMMVHVSSDKGKVLNITATLVNVIYEKAPQTWDAPDGRTLTVKAENKNAAGTIALTATQTVQTDTTSGGIQPLYESTNFNFDVSKLPQGFYRVYVETEDGRQIWDNAWILR